MLSCDAYDSHGEPGTDGGDLEVMRVKFRMDGFNASWSRLTSFQVLGFSWRESSVYMMLTDGTLPVWPICKGAGDPDIMPERTGGTVWKNPASRAGCCWMLSRVALSQDLDCCQNQAECSGVVIRWR